MQKSQQVQTGELIFVFYYKSKIKISILKARHFKKEQILKNYLQVGKCQT